MAAGFTCVFHGVHSYIVMYTYIRMLCHFAWRLNVPIDSSDPCGTAGRPNSLVGLSRQKRQLHQACRFQKYLAPHEPSTGEPGENSPGPCAEVPTTHRDAATRTHKHLSRAFTLWAVWVKTNLEDSCIYLVWLQTSAFTQALLMPNLSESSKVFNLWKL